MEILQFALSAIAPALLVVFAFRLEAARRERVREAREQLRTIAALGWMLNKTQGEVSVLRDEIAAIQKRLANPNGQTSER